MKILFDTNAYRKLIEGIDLNTIDFMVKDLTSCEKEKNYTPSICNIVAYELISHLCDDANATTYKSCLKSCYAMHLHCNNNIFPSTTLQISKEFYEIEFEQEKKTLCAILEILRNVNELKDYKELSEPIKKNIASIRKHINDTENTITEQIVQYCKKIDSCYTQWDLFIKDESKREKYLNYIRSEEFSEEGAIAMLYAVYNKISESKIYQIKMYTPNDIKEFIKRYSAALELRRFFYEQICQPNFDLTKKGRTNFLWDSQILYYAGKEINKDPILIFTNYKQMNAAAERTNFKDAIITLDEYFKSLNFNKDIYKPK